MPERKFAFLSAITIFIFLLTNLFIFYNISKKTFLNHMSSDTMVISEYISSDIDKFSSTIKISDALLSDSLRNAAIAIRNSLPIKYKDVTNDQLKDLASRLEVSVISLIALVKGDYTVVLSSDASRIGKKLSDCDTCDTAMSDPYWSVKPPVQSINSETHHKHGYYYEGEADYIINPYVDNGYYFLVNQEMDVDTYVNNILQDHKGELLDITALFWIDVIEPSVNRELTMTSPLRGTNPTEEDIFLGSNSFASSRDIDHMQRAALTGDYTTYEDVINGQRVIKTFYPGVVDGYTFIISITGNMEISNPVLNSLISKYGILLTKVTIISLLFGWAVLKLSKYPGRSVTNEHEKAEGNIDHLWVEVKGQRHDLNNHLDTLHGLIELGFYNEAKEYINEIVEETSTINEIIDIGQPEIAVLILSKMSQATAKNIDFQFEILNKTESKLVLLGSRKMDVVKILGNLLDNAFEEVMKLSPDQRLVVLNGEIRNDVFRFFIKNKLSQHLSPAMIKQMFLPRKTTKNSTGIGLSIVNERVKRNEGSIICQLTEEGFIQFNVLLPTEQSKLRE
ncbi:sensor histidine kinase [Paenibacillus urinalis]|uniref:GHKL domain-containing protein n=1 Tax=Paenibacillus urinalis TaxID=521520 RepID=A0AAX3N7P5_9BACL|nr:GHKL domain-containing protein [Paenibacillus urinalis]WDH85253.1 GHKL domain-containing protein [Paenibacillus urinalis]